MGDTYGAGWNAVSGNASASDYDLLTGGSLSYFQDPFSAADNGTLNNNTTSSPTGTASPSGTMTPPANGASYTPPSWLQSLFGQGTSGGVGGAINTAVGSLINGQHAAGPAQAGQTGTTGTGATTASNTLLSSLLTNPLVLLGGLGLVLWLVLRK
jgi:hypothetical protein